MMTGNPNTRKKYRKIWCEYESWCSGKGWAPNKENVLINYMHDQLQDGELGVGSIWNTYSMINSTMRQKFDINCNTWVNLRIVMKNMTKWYIPKKSEIISAEDFKRLITELLDETDPFERLTIVAISLMYFGLLRQGEVLAIDIIMVKMDWKREIIRVEFSKWTKSRAQGFAFAIPPYLFPVFERYMRELRPKKRRERFLKNYRPNKEQKGGVRIQNMGKDMLSRMLSRVCELLDMPFEEVTGHVWRRSGATALANSGMSILNLKRAGRWRSLSSCEQYLEHCDKVIFDRMNRLNGDCGDEQVLITQVSKKEL